MPLRNRGRAPHGNLQPFRVLLSQHGQPLDRDVERVFRLLDAMREAFENGQRGAHVAEPQRELSPLFPVEAAETV